MLDERFTRSLHVDALRRGDLHSGRDPHALFQASTIGALLDGAYEGDVSFGELRRQGNLGLGTLNGLDGEMIALDGEFFRAAHDGDVSPVPDEALTPFAVVVPFEAEHSLELAGIGREAALERIAGLLPEGHPACAVRIDGRFDRVRARSVPRQEPPYPPLAEVVSQQRVFEFTGAEGSIVGFRFPDHSDGIEIDGWHLHFISADRSRGGHVLDFEVGSAVAGVDPATDLHVELPPGVELEGRHLADEDSEAIRHVEQDG